MLDQISVAPHPKDIVSECSKGCRGSVELPETRRSQIEAAAAACGSEELKSWVIVHLNRAQTIERAEGNFCRNVHAADNSHNPTDNSSGRNSFLI